MTTTNRPRGVVAVNADRLEVGDVDPTRRWTVTATSRTGRAVTYTLRNEDGEERTFTNDRDELVNVWR